MDFALLKKLLHHLLTVCVTVYEGEPAILAAFEDRYCFQKELQPMFTAKSLSYLAESMNNSTFYEIIDKFDICLFFFRADEKVFLIGPYVRSEYSDQNTQRILIQNRMPASFAQSLKPYSPPLPLLGSYQIQRTVIACLASLRPVCPEYTYRRLLGFQEEPKEAKSYRQESIDYSDIYQRYNAENRLLGLIEKGRVEDVMQAFDEMLDKSSQLTGLFMSTAYQSPSSILRALARKAAEKSGLSVVIIDQITQKAVQHLSAASSIRKQTQYNYEMLIELTAAVRSHLSNTSGYSPEIVKVVEYLSLNYTQNADMEEMCRISGYSASYLSKLFKRETGKTITQYTADLRCRQAAEMLRETGLSVQEISSYVGYLDNNYFVKVFKKATGKTPSEYRASAAEPGRTEAGIGDFRKA